MRILRGLPAADGAWARSRPWRRRRLPGARIPSRLAQLEFRDQYGNVDSLARRSGAPVVVVVVSVRRLAMIEKWERDLSERVPGIRFLNVADLPTDVPVDLERTALTLRKRVPPGVNVLMDPAREWATTFALDTAAAEPAGVRCRRPADRALPRPLDGSAGGGGGRRHPAPGGRAP